MIAPRTIAYPYAYTGDGVVDRVFPRYNNSFDYVVQVQKAIQASKPGVHVASTSNEAVISGAVNLADYDTVIWITGNESNSSTSPQPGASKLPLDATEQAKLTAFIGGGGNLFLSGAEIAFDLDQQNNGRTFYESTLKGNYVNNDANTYTAVADAAGIFAGMSSFVFSNGAAFSSLDGQYYNVATPDVIAPLGGAISALSYSGGTGGTAAIQYGPGGLGSGSIVMFGFPFEVMTNAARQAAAMGRILDFFGAAAPLPDNADFNGDSTVDAADYVLWRRNNGLTTGATQSQGDANQDGAVNSADYDIWRAQFGTSPGSGTQFIAKQSSEAERLAEAPLDNPVTPAFDSKNIQTAAQIDGANQFFAELNDRGVKTSTHRPRSLLRTTAWNATERWDDVLSVVAKGYAVNNESTNSESAHVSIRIPDGSEQRNGDDDALDVAIRSIIATNIGGAGF